ncbi:hypothetical protein [Serratia liquefaciens]|uniref:hypothetical protein n=1 Tax=Serratia liquefaciens TaxID=614 RepID=UPI0021795A76|nr:hypothetical protein [Serratia liquefaciens]CAI1609741.1 Protein of uncharacterised function (DUF2570) [Serratia liquefaciens]
MSGWLTKLAGSGLLIMLVVSISLAGYSSLLSHRLELTRQQIAEQQKMLDQQAGLIATLYTQDAQNRALMAAQQQQEQQLRQQADIYQRKYRDAIKNDECASRIAPGAVLDLMHQSESAASRDDYPVTP